MTPAPEFLTVKDVQTYGRYLRAVVVLAGKYTELKPGDKIILNLEFKPDSEHIIHKSKVLGALDV